MELNKFKVFESIFTYCVDVIYTGLAEDEYIGKLGIDVDLFFSELYLQRKEKEEIIKSGLLTTTRPLLVYGFPGTGKTTIVTKVFYDLQALNHNILLIKFDFKGEDQINVPVVFETWFKNKLRSKLNVILEKNEISLFDIVFFLFSKENSLYELPVEIGNLKQKIYNFYKANPRESGELDFNKWLEININTDFVYQKIDKITDRLRNRDILFFLYKKLGHRIILFCDNMDSIIKHEIRKSFYEHIRSYSGAISKFANIVVTARYSTISNQSYTDYGAHYWEKISLDYREFIDQKNLKKHVDLIIKEKGYCNPIEFEQIKDKLERDVKEKFSKKFIEKRKVFFKKVLNNRDNLIVTEENEHIEELLDLIISNNHIHVALLELANHDRRWKLRFLVDFIKYIHYDLNIIIDHLGLNETERGFILESYFYHWVITNKRIELNGYDTINEIFNSEGELKCSLSHLIISLIYNYTKKERGVNTYGYSITIGKVIEEIEKIGYTRDLILRKIYGLYKKDDNVIGLIELSRYFDINSPNEIKDNDNIWLTPRAIYLCEYLNCKFVFMLAEYRFNNLYDKNGIEFNYDDANPVTTETIYLNLSFINQIATNHLHSLDIIKRKLGTKNWLEYFLDWFCLNQRYDDDNYSKRLQIEYILISHIKFLERLRYYSRYNFITVSMIEEYKRLLRLYRTNVNHIVENNEIEIFTINQTIFKNKKLL